jgi:glycosyltransferase involved in cell wall biosynthesis
MKELPAHDTSIALFLPNLRGGGAERVMVNLARGLAGRGCRVDLVLAKAEGPHLSKVAEDVRVVDLRSCRVVTSVLPLSKYLRSERPDVLVSALYHANVAALLARRLSRVSTRVIPTVHIPPSEDIARSNSRKTSILHTLTRWCYPWADAIVAVSRGTADDVVQTTGVPPQLVRVIYPEVTPGIRELAKAPVEHPWFAPGEPEVILGMGRLGPQKDFPTLIKAFALLRKDHDHRLMILGEGEQRRHLERLVHELGLAGDVSLPGFVENPFAYLARSSLFVLSSAWEAAPAVLIEALALDVPVVSTNCRTGPDEILNNGQYGRLVPVGDVEALAGAMREALSEPRPVVPEEALRPFTLDVVVDEYLKLIAEITA